MADIDIEKKTANLTKNSEKRQLKAETAIKYGKSSVREK